MKNNLKREGERRIYMIDLEFLQLAWGVLHALSALPLLLMSHPRILACWNRNLFLLFAVTGLYSGSHDVNMNGVLARTRRPFTPSQWLELEHQVSIYKYIDARVPIPPILLAPIRKSLSSSAFPHFSPGSFGSSACKDLELFSS